MVQARRRDEITSRRLAPRTFLPIYLRLVSVLTRRYAFQLSTFPLSRVYRFRLLLVYICCTSVRPSRVRPRRAVNAFSLSLPLPLLLPLLRFPPLVNPSTDAPRAALRLIRLIAFAERVPCVVSARSRDVRDSCQSKHAAERARCVDHRCAASRLVSHRVRRVALRAGDRRRSRCE